MPPRTVQVYGKENKFTELSHESDRECRACTDRNIGDNMQQGALMA
jgi:hypothetical protein